MSSRGCKAEEEREYRVSEPRQHPQGFTEYRVTARIISKKTADVVEITVFKRYSDFKKLHSELSYIHRNLFRKSEEFPAFPRAQVFGRFDEAVIEERRRSAEEMLQFTVNIPALYNSPQLKDFFKDGEVSRPLELAAANDAPSLPAPLIPLPSGEGELPGSWPSLSTGWAVSGGLPQSLSRSESDGGGEAVHTALHGPSPHGPAPHSPPRHTPGTMSWILVRAKQRRQTPPSIQELRKSAMRPSCRPDPISVTRSWHCLTHVPRKVWMSAGPSPGRAAEHQRALLRVPTRCKPAEQLGGTDRRPEQHTTRRRTPRRLAKAAPAPEGAAGQRNVRIGAPGARRVGWCRLPEGGSRLYQGGAGEGSHWGVRSGLQLLPQRGGHSAERGTR
ncbi:sorting nexin-15 isoform X3 [Carcharodon carcharias]|uniref:sorting nexin-15 isoform X3 n=1 Tax=Carcharodon carcharias TaxID=13397 RepID=UPI001B7F38FE|nr:sorting nexin-15 isoform X3 [Carcharodon carcharias]